LPSFALGLILIGLFSNNVITDDLYVFSAPALYELMKTGSEVVLDVICNSPDFKKSSFVLDGELASIGFRISDVWGSIVSLYFMQCFLRL
jgi:hypothetical protein